MKHQSMRHRLLKPRLSRQFHVKYFNWKRDLIVTEAMIPAIVKGLCAHGGRKGMLAASRLQETEER